MEETICIGVRLFDTLRDLALCIGDSGLGDLSSPAERLRGGPGGEASKQ
jgi:hypothetical protein